MVLWPVLLTSAALYLQDLDATLRFFEVAKRVTLFLARVAPQHTIDTLVYEIQQQVRTMASLPGWCRAAGPLRMAAFSLVRDLNQQLLASEKAAQY